MTTLLTLQCGQAIARLAPELGGRITTCTLVDPNGLTRPVLHPYPEQHTDLAHWGKGGLYPLMPYSGRLRDAKIHGDGRIWSLAPYEGSVHTLHGIAHRRPWVVQRQEASALTLQYRHVPDEHWPWPFDAQMAVSLDEHALAVTLTLTNAGDRPMPGGLGMHPYMPVGAQHELQFHASAPCVFDDDYLMRPAAAVPVQSLPQKIELDEAGQSEVTRMHALWDGQLNSVCDGHVLGLHAQGALTHLIVHRPRASPYVCIEPVSHLPDAFNLASPDSDWMGAVTLAPGRSLSGRLTLSFQTAA